MEKNNERKAGGAPCGIPDEKERDGLDLARPAPRRRHKTLRQLCALLLGLAGLALLSMAVWGAALPRRLDDALAQHYAAQMSVMQRELFALRRRLAEHEPDAEENAALRNFFAKAGRRTANTGTPCGPPPAGPADFCWRSR